MLRNSLKISTSNFLIGPFCWFFWGYYHQIIVFLILVFISSAICFPHSLIFQYAYYKNNYCLFSNELFQQITMFIMGFTKFGIKVLWRLEFLEYLRTLSLKFQKARTKIEVVLTLPCCLSQFSWDSQQSQDNFNFGPSLLKF